MAPRGLRLLNRTVAPQTLETLFWEVAVSGRGSRTGSYAVLATFRSIPNRLALPNYYANPGGCPRRILTHFMVSLPPWEAKRIDAGHHAHHGCNKN
jgi:hypothetical protein